MTVFQTLDQLGGYLATRSGIEIVDPGVNLTDWADDLARDPTWKNQPSIRKVVGFVARNLASTPLHAFEMVDETDRKRLRDGRLAALLKSPSRAPGMTPYRFWERLLIDGLLRDKYCAQIVEHDGWDELVRIPARRVKFESDSLDRITTVVIRNGDGSTVERDPADYLIDVGYAEKGANGTSPLVTLRNLLDEYSESVEYRRSIWKNGARVPGLIMREKPWPADGLARDRFTRTWRAFTKDGGQAGGTPVLDDGMTYKEVNAFKPRDTLDLEGRTLTDIEVCNAYYIAPELVGAREGNFSSIKAFKQMLYGPNLGPYFDAWQQQLNSTLTPRFEPDRDVYIEANIESKLRGGFEEQADIMSTAVGGPWMTRAEGRARMNLSHLDGTDELITPLNVIVGGQASPQDGT